MKLESKFDNGRSCVVHSQGGGKGTYHWGGIHNYITKRYLSNFTWKVKPITQLKLNTCAKVVLKSLYRYSIFTLQLLLFFFLFDLILKRGTLV